MPSPFPGMDPYLEAPHRWGGVHNLLISFITAHLNERLPPGFAADSGERLYVEQHERHIVPDSWVSKEPLTITSDRSGGAAVLDRAEEMRIAFLAPDEFREPYVEILSLDRPRRVVTVIEVLSYANKGASSVGRALYLEKQSELLNSEVSLLEIDLLRRGAHSVAIPESVARQHEVYDYLICLHRAGAGTRYDYLPIKMRRPLPKVPVPLTPGLDDAVLDLQETFDRMYDAGAYARKIDYSQDCPVPLSPEDVSWANALLREKGLGSTPDANPT